MEYSGRLDRKADSARMETSVGSNAKNNWTPKSDIRDEEGIDSGENYGCPMLWADGITDDAPDVENFQGILHFNQSDLSERYRELSPKGIVDLVVIGCPQASVGEARSTAAFMRSRMELGEKIQNHRLWVFMSSHNYDLIEADGTLDILEEGCISLEGHMPRSNSLQQGELQPSAY